MECKGFTTRSVDVDLFLKQQQEYCRILTIKLGDIRFVKIFAIFWTMNDP